MIGKAKSISHVSNAIDYARLKMKAVEVSRNLVVNNSGKEIAREFRIFQNLNNRCHRNSFSFVLSPAIEDGLKLTNYEFGQLSVEFLKHMQLENHQHVAYIHRDREHAHLHIFVNRVDERGRAYKDNYIGKKTQRLADRIALEHQLISAKQVQMAREDRRKEKVLSAHEKALKMRPKSIADYTTAMRACGIEILPKLASNGKLVGATFKMDDSSIKASAVHRSLSAANLQKLFDKNQFSFKLKR